MKKNLTSLVSCFARGYHYLNNDMWVFEDPLASVLIGKNEYREISESMVEGIQFFNPQFKGTKEEALEWVVNHQLAPTVLARSAFYQDCLKQKMDHDMQYLILGAGLDSFAYTLLKGLNVFEVDRQEVIDDKQQRLKSAHIDDCHVRFVECNFEDDYWFDALYQQHYRKDLTSFSSLLGVCYYLNKDDFSKLLRILNENAKSGSYVVFDYPSHYQSEESIKTKQLALSAGESMKAHYEHEEMENLLLKYNFEIERHLDFHDVKRLYFDKYNHRFKTCKITPFCDVKYVFAKKR